MIPARTVIQDIDPSNRTDAYVDMLLSNPPINGLVCNSKWVQILLLRSQNGKGCRISHGTSKKAAVQLALVTILKVGKVHGVDVRLQTIIQVIACQVCIK
jgi:hypothetical protein